MYAVIASGGKQYKMETGQVYRLEKLEGQVGDAIGLAPVLMVGGEGEPKVGRPYLEGQVSAVIIEQGRMRNILVFKKKRRKGYRVKRGHRQPFTAVRVEGIQI
ncbi:50S ribosomal subunit protein L21 [Desulfarculales bacterium]